MWPQINVQKQLYFGLISHSPTLYEIHHQQPRFALHVNLPSDLNQASMYGPPSQSEAADAAAGAAVPPPSSSSSSSSPPSSSTSAFCPSNFSSRHIVERQPRMLNFRVEYRQRTVELVLEEGSSVGEHPLPYMHNVWKISHWLFQHSIIFSAFVWLNVTYRRNQTNPGDRAWGSSVQNAAEGMEEWRCIRQCKLINILNLHDTETCR